MSDATDLAAMAHICDYLRHENRELRRLVDEALLVLESSPGTMRCASVAFVLRAELADLDARRLDPMVRA